ncbi:MAG: calcineurin-like phosphoesterase family protein [candidate division KSB1 bacterium]|nr:calcineurin-like phosphoesterase family protein [candidate division KSB1 bacterium]MDZ7399725.1 calcineurin-like phosphoesterase family protein [candidate division KSB1 bacterium]
MSLRIKLLLIAATILSVSILPNLNLRGKEISGTVFEDANKNLKYDKGERGLPGVRVSNQQDVVVTDAQGRYRLPIDDETIIFIIKPIGYTIPTNEKQLPQFYYIHQPKGSPDANFKHKGLAPTGKLPASLDFPLFKTDEPDRFEVIVFSDPQPRNHQEIDYIRDDVVAELIGTNALFGITLGDITFDDLSLYDRYNQIVAQIGIPFYNVPGNHDMNYDAADDRYSLETFKRHFGPSYYSFDVGKVHFIVLDVVEYLGKDAEGRSRYQGKIGDRQLRWLSNDLKFVPKDHLIVLNMHIPIYTSYGDDASINVVDRTALFELLKDRDRVLALAGHMHNLEHNFIGERLGWQGKQPMHQVICAAVSGTWWTGPKDERGIPIADQRDGTPNGYHIICFEGNRYYETFKAAKFGIDFQLRISDPVGKIGVQELQQRKVVVNVFDGSEKSTVEWQLDGGIFQKMEQTAIKDPYYERIYHQVKADLPTWVAPEISTHIWTAPLPPDLSRGVHKIVVKTVDQFGREFEAASIFEVAE